MEVVKGMELTEYRLDSLVNSIQGKDYVRIRDLHSDIIPNGEYSARMVLKFIICAVPNVATYTDEEILSIINTKVIYSGLTDKKALLKLIKKCSAMRPVLSKVADTFRGHKHCPISVKKNNDWCVLVVLSELQMRLDCDNTLIWYMDELKKYVE